ncbi:hypothetical protein L3X38_031577 [Prunus dulcis]|uniref:Carboxypeptidase n=1 Tax=Prunus dulcis TaxID=3755 RepID=A0AAD4VCF9_PRUDU|nr:hypothetical protein L3X38_031577 [Prunus dulcis]
MEKHSLSLVLSLLLFLPLFHGGITEAAGTLDGSEEWGYVEVRPKAHMFWWLYRSPNRGGPGASGVGIGNFEEIGPLDTNLNPRNSTWLQKADLLFVDNPVGRNENLQKSPLFIVAESYGGKFAVTLGLSALKAIEAGKLKLRLGGVALGDSWISPEDFVLSWGPLLKDVSRLDDNGLKEANSVAQRIKQQIQNGQLVEATNSWSELEQIISSNSNSVDFYNFLLDSGMDPVSSLATIEVSKGIALKKYSRYLSSLRSSSSAAGGDGVGDLDTLLNGVIKKKLKIIPDNVTWGGQSDHVFTAMEGDFMKPRINEVDELPC